MVTADAVHQRRDRRGGGRARGRGEDGYNLVILIVAITILNVVVAVALPLWSYTIRRDREEETIFRGLQYAEGIRVFHQRFGRYPTTLAELVEVEPRSIRQLWGDPLTEHGEFGLVIEAPPHPPGEAGERPVRPIGEPVKVPGLPGRTVVGAFGAGPGQQAVNLIKQPRLDDTGEPFKLSGPAIIHGVYLDHEGESLRTFLGQQKYEQWAFVAELIAPPVTAPDRPLPRVRDDWLGKAFPEGLQPTVGGAAGGQQGGGAGAPVPGTAPDSKPGFDQKQRDPDSDSPKDASPDAFPDDDLESEDEDEPEDEIDPEDEVDPEEDPFSDDPAPSEEDVPPELPELDRGTGAPRQ
jgi:type II secretory pathway pseudopilin PulG